MVKSSNKKAIMLAIIGLFFVLIGATYAIFSTMFRGNVTTSITTDGIAFKYIEGTNKISLNNAIPILDEEGKNLDNYFEFYISANSKKNIDIPYYITLRKASSSSNIDEAIRLYLTKVDNKGNEEEVALYNFNEISQYENAGIDLSKYTEKLLYSDKVTGNKRYYETYRLRMWIDYDTNFADSKYNNANFSLTVNVYSNGEVTLESSDDVEQEVLRRVASIRSTSNTDISKRTGNIYYVSSDGNDSNNGLSESNAWKSLDKVEEMFTNKQIADHSTILFRDGDTFYGNVNVNADDIMMGSYGDISKGKPILTRSPFNGASVGEWIEVKPNIWKFTKDGTDQVFKYNVGMIIGLCDKDNNNCTKSMSTMDRKFEFAQLITTNSVSYDEANIEDKIDTILTHDLEFYHVGHAYNLSAGGKALYLYSTSNPAERFDDIEFAQSVNLVSTYNTKKTNLTFDNLKILYAGASGILGKTTSNMVITNSEFGFIGGAVHKYEKNGEVSRIGNAVTPVSSIEDIDGYPVVDGYVIKNCYAYQVFDAAFSFQFSAGQSDDTRKHSRIEKGLFTNNVIEYNNYNFEYWTSTSSTDYNDINRSYINQVEISNNIMRYPGTGICETRPDKGNSAHLKTWNRYNIAYNIIKGNFEIKDNIFVGAKEQYIYIRATDGSKLPTFTNNTFIGDGSVPFGKYTFIAFRNTGLMEYDTDMLANEFPTNTFININGSSNNYNNDSGTTGSAKWEYNAKTGTLSITGTGIMGDYAIDNPAPWYQYKDKIFTINIGEGITRIGNYTFYNLDKVRRIKIESINLESLDTNNYAFYHVGDNTTEATLIFGKKVTKVPKYLTRPISNQGSTHNINNVVFEGTSVTSIGYNALAGIKAEKISIPEGVTTLGEGSIILDGYLRIAVLPKSMTTVSKKAVSYNAHLAKVIFGDTTSVINQNTFMNDKEITTVIIPNITNTETVYGDLFAANTSTPITVYGNSSTETWYNNLMTAINADTGTKQTNITYKPLSEYTSEITSNEDIFATVGFDESYTFTTTKSVKAFTYYIGFNDSKEPIRLKIADVNVEKNGNTYTIKNIRQDTYIELK